MNHNRNNLKFFIELAQRFIKTGRGFSSLLTWCNCGSFVNVEETRYGISIKFGVRYFTLTLWNYDIELQLETVSHGAKMLYDALKMPKRIITSRDLR